MTSLITCLQPYIYVPWGTAITQNPVQWFSCCYYVTHTCCEGKQGRTPSITRKRDKQYGLSETSIQWEIRLHPASAQLGFNLQRCLIPNGLSMSIRNYTVRKSACRDLSELAVRLVNFPTGRTGTVYGRVHAGETILIPILIREAWPMKYQ